MSLFCTVCANRRFNLPRLYLALPLGLTPFEFRRDLLSTLSLRNIYGRRAFTVGGPTAWNSLPDYLCDPSLSEDTFRRLLKTYLLALY